ASESSTLAQAAPIAHAPKAISPTLRPVRPKGLLCMGGHSGWWGEGREPHPARRALSTIGPRPLRGRAAPSPAESGPLPHGIPPPTRDPAPSPPESSPPPRLRGRVGVGARHPAPPYGAIAPPPLPPYPERRLQRSAPPPAAA